MTKKRVLITTVPFADKNQLPLELLESADLDYLINPLNRKLQSNELAEMVQDFDAVIAGTETIDKNVFLNANKLKLISRVGIGLDGVDLNFARQRDIQVAYTPDAPSPAVAELTIGLMISLLRGVHLSNMQMRSGEWKRIFGRRLSEITIGIIGAGRIGGRVIRRLVPFGSPRVLVNDISPNQDICPNLKLEWVTKDYIFRNADLISIHVPLSAQTRNLIGKEELSIMKPGALLINTARGGIINELDLFEALNANIIAGAAIDVFEKEPYSGPLTKCKDIILTAHMGSMSEDCRTNMEIQATKEVIRFFNKEPLLNEVPETEYLLQSEL